MKRVWNKETRNLDGSYYREGDWGIEVPDDFNKDNFTEEPISEEAVQGMVETDWNETTNAWVDDASSAQQYNDRLSAIQAFEDSPLNGISISDAEQIIDDIGNLDEAKVVLKRMAKFMIGLREVLREIII